MAEDTIRIKLESNLNEVANATKGLNLTKSQQESADKYISSAKFGLANQDLKLFQQNFNKLVDLFKNAAASSGTLSKTIEQLTNKQLQLNKEINSLRDRKTNLETKLTPQTKEFSAKAAKEFASTNSTAKKVLLSSGAQATYDQIIELQEALIKYLEKTGKNLRQITNADVQKIKTASGIQFQNRNAAQAANSYIAQQDAYAAGIKKDLTSTSEELTAKEAESNALYEKINKLDTASANAATGLDELYKKIVNIATATNSTITEENNKQKKLNTDNTPAPTTGSVTEVNATTKNNNSTIGKAFKQFSLYAIALRTIKQAAREAISTIKELDKSLTEQAMVTGKTREQTYKLLSSYQALAAQTGSTTKEIADLATQFMRQGKTTQESLVLTEAAMSAAKVAGISATDSINYLTTALNGFQLSASDAMSVSDKFAAIAANAATSYDEIAIALSKVASQANLAGMSIDYTTALLAKGLETTREAPETIGTALKTIIARMRELSDYGETLGGDTDINNVESQLAYVGIALRDNNGELRSTEEVLDELGRKWDTLNSNQQAAVAKALAGTRQQSRLIAMMSDYERVIELQQIAERSSGATLSQMSTYLEGMDAALNRVSVAWESIITSITNNEVIINLVNMGASLLQVVNDIFNNAAAMVPIVLALAIYGTSVLKSKLEEYAISIKQNQLEKERTLEAAKQQVQQKTLAVATAKNDAAQLKANAQKQRAENAILKTKIDQLKASPDAEKNKQQIAALEQEVIANEQLAASYDQQADQLIKNAEAEQDLAQSNLTYLENQQSMVTNLTTGWKGFGNTMKTVIMSVIPQLGMMITQIKNVGKASEKAGQKNAGNSAAVIPVIGWIIWAVIMGASIISTVVSAIQSFLAMSESVEEKTNKFSNEIYQLETKASAINTITKSYDDLDKKLIKTNADQEEMNNLLDQAADKLDEEQKNAYKALQTNKDRLKYLKAIQQQSEEEADVLRRKQINLISNASSGTKNALLDENTTDSKILTAQAAIYANNNNELYKYIDSLTEAKAGVEDLAEILLGELTPAQALAFAEQPELISKLVDSLNSLSTTYTSLSDSSVKGTAAEVLTSDDYSIVDKVNAYKDAIASLDNEMAKILETTYSDIAVFAEFDTTILDFINRKNFTVDGINSVGKAIQELGYDTTQSTQMIQLLFAAINSGSSIQDAIYNTFGRGLSDTDYNNILKAYSDAIGTGVLNMGQNIQSLKNTINSFYETAMKWNDLTDSEKTSFMVDNAELFKGQEGAQLLKAIESQDYNLIYAALSDKDGTLYKKVQQQIKDIDEEIELEYAKLEEERDYAYIKYLEDQRKVLKDSENLYAASLENRLEQEQKYLNEYKSYLEDQKEALTDSLDKRKEAYSDYFETVNQEAETEDFKTQEQTLIANISKLATTGNATAANQAADLKQQLQDLEKERLETLRQQAQDNLMNSIEDEVSEINEKFDKLLNSQSALLAAMTQDLSDPTKFLSNIIANKATQEGLTMTGLQSYVKDIQSIYSPLLGNDVLSKISVREEGNSLILNVNGEEINLSNSDQQSIYEAIMLALKQVGLK